MVGLNIFLTLSLARKKRVMNGLEIPEFIMKSYQQMKNAVINNGNLFKLFCSTFSALSALLAHASLFSAISNYNTIK